MTLPLGPADPPWIIDPLPIEVSRPLVLLRLGYRRPDQVPAKIAGIIDEVSDTARGLLAPRAVCGRFPVHAPEKDRLAIGAALCSPSRSLREGLLDCRCAVLFAATIGGGLEAWVRGLAAAGEEARCLLGDAYGSSAAIALGLAVETIVARAFTVQGLAAARRCAPGYGDWDLRDQGALLGLLGAERIGITLTEDALMIPAKSISGVIGGRAPGISPNAR